MVVAAHILKLLHAHFVIKGKVEIDPQGGVSVRNVPGVSPKVGVMLITPLESGILPVRFDTVEGDFQANNKNVKSLKGFPRVITGILDTKNNVHLRQLYDCEITHVGEIWLSTYRQTQHILRMLVAKDVYLEGAPDIVDDIMHRHAGEGKQGAIACAVELIKAGFRENARW